MVFDHGKYGYALWLEGRLWTVTINLKAGTSSAAAQAEAKLLLPPDIEFAWSKRRQGCDLVQWRSKLLGTEYPLSKGSALVAFQSGPDQPYNPNDVQDVYLEASAYTAEDFPNC
jgi:hypothetical protein